MQKILNEELGRKSVEEFKKASKTPIIIVLDNVRSALNVGSVFRTADAFLVEAIYLCGITAVPPNKEIVKTALGATETVQWKYFEHTIDAIYQLKKMKYKVVSIEQVKGAFSLEKYHPEKTEKTALVFGHEVNGVNQEIVSESHACIEIPQIGSKHSLNIAVSAGIVIWEMFKKINF